MAGEYFSDLDIVGVLCTSDAGLADAERLQHLRAGALERRRAGAAGQVGDGGGDAQRWPRPPTRPRPTWESSRRFSTRTLSGGQAAARSGEHSRRPRARRGSGARHAGDTGSFSSFVSLDGCNVDECEGQCVVQEFLKGTEYIVDTFSADGEHKCLGFWRYAKGPENGAPFVYHCDELKAVESEVERAIIEYAFAALDALEWKWGTCHLEIMWAEGKGAGGVGSGAALIEANMERWNGDDFSLIARTGTG